MATPVTVPEVSAKVNSTQLPSRFSIMHVYVKLANFTAKPRFENLVACFRGSSDSRAQRSVGNKLNGTPGKRGGGENRGDALIFFLREFFCRALLSERLKQAKNLAIGQALFRSASTFVNSIEFSFHNLSNITFRSQKKTVLE